MKTRKLTEREVRETVDGRFSTSRMRGENRSREVIEREVRSENIEVAVSESTTGGASQEIRERRYPFIPRQDEHQARAKALSARLSKGFTRLGLSSDAAEVAAGKPNSGATAKNLSSYLGVSQAVASKMLDRS